MSGKDRDTPPAAIEAADTGERQPPYAAVVGIDDTVARCALRVAGCFARHALRARIARCLAGACYRAWVAREVDGAVLALDVGTSSCRASLYDRRGEPLKERFAHVTYSPTVTADGGAELDPELLLDQ